MQAIRYEMRHYANRLLACTQALAAGRTIDARLLLLHALAANEEPGGEVVPRADAAQLVEYLRGQLARGRDDQRAQAVVAAPAQPEQLLQQLGSQTALSRAAGNRMW